MSFWPEQLAPNAYNDKTFTESQVPRSIIESPRDISEGCDLILNPFSSACTSFAKQILFGTSGGEQSSAPVTTTAVATRTLTVSEPPYSQSSPVLATSVSPPPQESTEAPSTLPLNSTTSIQPVTTISDTSSSDTHGKPGSSVIFYPSSIAESPGLPATATTVASQIQGVSHRELVSLCVGVVCAGAVLVFTIL